MGAGEREDFLTSLAHRLWESHTHVMGESHPDWWRWVPATFCLVYLIYCLCQGGSARLGELLMSLPQPKGRPLTAETCWLHPATFLVYLLPPGLPTPSLSAIRARLAGRGWMAGGGGGFFWCCWYWVLLGLSPNVEQQIEQKNEEHLTSQKPLIFDKFQRESGRK